MPSSTRPQRAAPALHPSTFRLPIQCVLLFLSCLHTILLQTSAFHFYLHAGQTRCFSDSASPNTKVLIEYTVSTGTGVMPVDLRVTLPDIPQPLATHKDAEHGKLAFVVPYPDTPHQPRVLRAEARRHVRDHWSKAYAHSADDKPAANFHPPPHFNPPRRLLSVDHHPPHPPADHARPPQPPPSSHEHEKYPYDRAEMRRRAHQLYGANRHTNFAHRHVHHGDDAGDDDDEHDDDDVDDDEDDLDMDEYDGIHDDDLEDEVRENMRRHPSHMSDDDSADDDVDGESALFNSRRFEVCLSNIEHKNDANRRRVKLVVRKGDSAHDYTRLAKMEHMSMLERSLLQISQELRHLMHELDMTQQRERVLYKLNEGTNRRVIVLSISSLIVMVMVATYQSVYTKHYFKRKKVL